DKHAKKTPNPARRFHRSCLDKDPVALKCFAPKQSRYAAPVAARLRKACPRNSRQDGPKPRCPPDAPAIARETVVRSMDLSAHCSLADLRANRKYPAKPASPAQRLGKLSLSDARLTNRRQGISMSLR